MKVTYINYADKKFRKQQKIALLSARYLGRFDNVIGFSPKDIDADFYNKHQNILSKKRGAGYWLWKPYFICRVLSQLSDGDYLFYSDSGICFLKSIKSLIKELDIYNQDIMGFELPLIEEQWTKKELFINMNCDHEKYTKSNQLHASFILIKKTEKSIPFFQEFLNLTSQEKNVCDILDQNIQSGLFIDHRHDQSIFSLLYKKHNLKPFKDPSQLGKHPLGYAGITGINSKKLHISKLYNFENGRIFRINKHEQNYSLLLYHNKNRSPLISLVKFLIKDLLNSMGLYKGIVR